MANARFTKRAVRLLIAHRWWAFAAALCISLIALPIAGRLSFDRSIENMFAADDPLLPPYRKLKRVFGGNEIVVAAYVDSELMTAAGFQRIRRLTEKLAAVDGVQSAISISSTPLGAAIVEDHAASGDLLELLEAYAVGPEKNGQRDTAAVVCLLTPLAPDDLRRRTIAQMREHVEQHEIPGVIAGEPVMVIDGFRFITDDGETLGYTCLVLLSATILICFRSLRWVVIPLLVIQFTLIMTRASLVLAQFNLSMVSSMLTAIVTVVAVATVVHVIVRYRDARAEGARRVRAMLAAGRLLAVPVVLACATDAVGFGSLLRAGVGPVQDFGVMMAIGSLLVIAATALLVPALALAGTFDIDPKRAWGERSLDRGLSRLVDTLLAHPRAVAAVSFLVALVVALGSARLEVETNFTRNFRRSSDIVRSYEFIESRLGGAGVLDVLVPAPQEIDHAFFERLRKLEARLRADVVVYDANGRRQPGLTKVLGLAAAVDASRPGALSRIVPSERLTAALSMDEVLAEVSADQLLEVISPSDLLEQLQLPPWLAAMAQFAAPEKVLKRVPAPMLETLLKQMPPKTLLRLVPPEKLDELWKTLSPELQLRVMRRLVPEMVGSLYNQDERYVRIMLRSYEQQPSHQKQQIIAQIRQICDEAFPAPEYRPVEVTGFFVLLTSLIDSMIRDQWICFAWAVGGIGLMMLVAFRDLRLALIALVPNAVPIMMVTGLMGWLGIKINMGAAMIAAVSMGLSIDSSIHYITAFRRARRRGAAVRDALHEVHQSVGRAMIFSTLALIVGFTALCSSQFIPTIYFGALVSLSMLGGLLGNLVVLPLLLMFMSTTERTGT